MEGILLHVLYRGEKANDFASEMERSGLRAAVLAEEGYPLRPAGDLALLYNAHQRPVTGIDNCAQGHQQLLAGCGVEQHAGGHAQAEAGGGIDDANPGGVGAGAGVGRR